jgi:PST family polysaccharide transporter
MRSAWTLVFGFCIESAVRSALSYFFCPYMPSLRLDGGAIRDILRFSRGLFGLSFLNLIFARADIFVLAKLYSPSDLGLYTVAIYLVQTPASFVMSVLSQTLMPAFAQTQTDSLRTNRMLIQVPSFLLMLGLPAVSFICLCGRSLLTLVYGGAYGTYAGAMAMASGVVLINLLNNQITSVFYSGGAPHLHRRAVAAMALTIVVAIYPLSEWLGPIGGQLARLIAVVVGYLLQIYRMTRLTGLDLKLYAKSFPTVILGSLTAGGIAVIASWFHLSTRPLATLSVGAIGCLAAYWVTWTLSFKKQRSL